MIGARFIKHENSYFLLIYLAHCAGSLFGPRTARWQHHLNWPLCERIWWKYICMCSGCDTGSRDPEQSCSCPGRRIRIDFADSDCVCVACCMLRLIDGDTGTKGKLIISRFVFHCNVINCLVLILLLLPLQLHYKFPRSPELCQISFTLGFVSRSRPRSLNATMAWLCTHPSSWQRRSRQSGTSFCSD